MTPDSKTAGEVTLSVGELSCQLCSETRTVAFAIPGRRVLTEEEIIQIGSTWICNECRYRHSQEVPN